jgi:Zn-dependent M16 (insulinase) family peptidase
VPLAKLRARLAAGEPVFENLIKKYLLENGHKVSVKVRKHLHFSKTKCEAG